MQPVATSILGGETLNESKPLPKEKKRPNYVQIHSKPLPLEIYPLPTFHPSHPLSLIQLAWTWINQMLLAPTDHQPRFTGYFSYSSRSVHVVDSAHIRALWEMGFFGKGTLSRSEPSWLEREKARLEASRRGGGTAEEWTAARREERRRFKLERAREEREKIQRQRAIEQGLIARPEDVQSSTIGKVDFNSQPRDRPVDEIDSVMPDTQAHALPLLHAEKSQSSHPEMQFNIDSAPGYRTENLKARQNGQMPIALKAEDLLSVHNGAGPIVDDREHLQLTLEEAFFLSYALGVLDIHVPERPGDATSIKDTSSPFPSNKHITLDNFEALELFRRHSTCPPATRLEILAPDDSFLLNYVVYHHFRSLGWVVRPGIKFSCDFLLYNRGPVFSHAEYAVMVLPSYTHSYWNAEEQCKQPQRRHAQKDWWWLHCINRVQTQVKKTLVLAYVEVPPPLRSSLEDISTRLGATQNIENLLRRYKVREFTIRRWLPNRSRD